MGLYLPQRWRRQPQIALGINWGSPLSSDLQLVYTRDVLLERKKTSSVSSRYASNGGINATSAGLGYKIGGNIADYVRFDTNYVLPAASPCTLEALVIGSSFPPLTTTVTLSTASNTNGDVGLGGGTVRSLLNYPGADPCNMSWWASNIDYNSAQTNIANSLQHIVLTKAAGTNSALTITVYRNGVTIASGAGTGTDTYVDSGPYFYLGGGHPSRGSTITGTIVKAAVYSKALSAAEVADLYVNPWQSFVPIPARQYFFSAGAAPTATGQYFDKSLNVLAWF
jgi:hypothetical protein